jgi:hypothetical protein
LGPGVRIGLQTAFLDNINMWRILKFTGDKYLHNRQKQSLLHQIYNYGVDDMFKAAAAEHCNTLAIKDWTHLRRSGERKSKLSKDHKMIVDLVKAVMRRDTIVSMATSVFQAGIQADSKPTHPVCLALCDDAAKHVEGDGTSIPVPREEHILANMVFMRVINPDPQMRHLQHVAGCEGSASYITVNKLEDCVVLQDGSVAFCRINPEPTSLKIDAAFVPDCINALKSLTSWEVHIHCLMVASFQQV